MTTTSFVRGRLRVTHPDSYRATTVRPRTRSVDAATSGDVDQMLVETLRRGGFVPVQRLRVGRTTTQDRSVDDALDVTVRLELDVVQAEDAVVLVEQAGCYTWARPRHETPRDTASSGRTAVFEIVVPGSPSTRGIAGVRTREVRATVLSYAAPLVGRAAIALLEAVAEPGLVHITGPNLAQWQRIDRLDEVGLSPDRTNRVLLLVHGTFDSTIGAFGGLTATESGRAFLTAALADYDAVLGFDHRTLSVDPRANADDLAERLSAFRARQQVTLDVVCHSRGGLTTRSFVESVLPGQAWRGRVDRSVFVAATNAGTHFADPSRWADLVDVYTNLVAANARAIADLPGGGPVAAAALGAVRGLGALVKWLASFATDPDSVPGIGAMVPDGPFVADLNQDQPGQPRPGTPWFVVSSNFEVTLSDHPPELPASVVSRIVDGVVDEVITGDNDLVVDVASMSAIDLTHGGGYVRDTLALGTNSSVYHTNYFTQDGVCRALQTWLVDRVDHLDGTPPPAAASASDDEADGGAVQRGPSRGPVEVEERRLPDGFHVPPSRAEPPPSMAEPPPETGAAPGPEPEVKPPAHPTPAPAVTATLVAELPQHPPVGAGTTLRIRVSRSALVAEDGTASAHTVLAVRPDVPVDIQVIPTANVALDGPDLDRLLLPPGGGWAELQFALHAVAAGPVRITVLARQDRDLLGRVVLEAEAVDPSEFAGGEEVLVRQQVEVASASSPVLAAGPWLEIAQVESEGETRFRYELRLPGVADRITAVSAPVRDPDAFVANLFRDVQQLRFDYSTRPARYLAKLQDLGSSLCEQLFPQEFQEVLWTNRDRLDDLFLLADEPFIPWELVHLKPPVGPRQAEPRFLGQLGLVRWQFMPFPPAPTLQARSGQVFAVCPDYEDGTLDRDELRGEAEFLASTLGATAVPATERRVRALLRRRSGFDVLHFSGHGGADPGHIGDARIALTARIVKGELRPDYLSSTTVAENARFPRRDGPGPLVVLNACQVGRAGEELTTLGGFARAFLGAGASAFVSSLWAVQQAPARTFVETFYQRLLGGDTVAAAAVAARQAARAEGDATWLAYVIYARPDAVLVR